METTNLKKGGDGTTSKNEEREGQPQEEIGEQNHRKKKEHLQEESVR